MERERKYPSHRYIRLSGFIVGLVNIERPLVQSAKWHSSSVALPTLSLILLAQLPLDSLIFENTKYEERQKGKRGYSQRPGVTAILKAHVCGYGTILNFFLSS